MPNKNSSTAPTTKSGRERRASEKAKSMLDAATEKANNKQETAQKSAERAEKRSRKKAKTAEITRRRNQENEHMYCSQFICYACNTRNAKHMTTYSAFGHPAS
ncbi:hypothetical protein PILCRDRAFT_327399 [Piloderma croceum F 1598]|uniref:Uncharacterized protein n=1 Tax=Piloderma croceum (strain F 1598) TaxID=765440 RepID=A0A0C3G719_PILCF|nr:hypothetical protein PILCRDRAFT_327399 [Piloderma croceum F 1598]